MAIDDYLGSVTAPALGPEDLGGAPLGPAPVMPPAPQAQTPGFLGQLLRMLPAIVGAGMGPGAGTGMLAGYATGLQQEDARKRQAHLDATAQYRIDQQAFQQQQQQAGALARQRELLLQQNLSNLRTAAQDAPDKAAYDALVEAYG